MTSDRERRGSARPEGDSDALHRLARFSLDRASFAAYWIAPDARLIYVNEAASRMLGYGSDELLGMKVHDIDPNFSVAVWAEHWKELAHRGQVVVESEHRTKQGYLIPVEVSANYLEFEGKEYNLAFVRETTADKQAERELQYRSEFQALITRISTRFINLRAEELDEGLERALREIGEFTGVDRGQIFLFDEQAARMNCICEWTRERVPRFIDRLQDIDVDRVQWVIDRMRRFTIIAVKSLDEIPENEIEVLAILRKVGMKSFIDVPIGHEGRVLGFLGLGTVTEERSWSQDEQALLEILGEIVANALERQRMDRALQESRERLQLALDSAQLGMWDWAPATGRLVRSEAQAQSLGYSVEETDPDLAFFKARLHPEDVAPTMAALDAHLAGRTALYEAEYRLRHRDGHYLWQQDRGMSVERNAEGGVVRMVGVTQDVTGRIQAEQALLDSDRRLRSVIENAPVVLWAVDLDGIFTFSAGRGLAALGISPGSAVGQSAFEMYGDDEEIVSAIRRALAGETLRSTTRVNGTVFDTHYAPLHDDGGNLIGATGVSVDITERRRAEEERTRLSTAVEQAAEAIMLTDTEGRVQYVNPAFEQSTGYSRDEILGQDPRLLNSGAHGPEYFEEMWRAIRGGHRWTGRLTNLRRDGVEIEEEATISPILNRKGEVIGYVWIARDVTEQVQLEAMLRQSQKMEAVGQLAGGVAHDFNNILQVIHGYTDLALGQTDEEQATHHYLEEVTVATERAAGLVRQLLTFSRREKLRPERLDLDEVVLGTIKMLGRVIGEHIDLDVHSSGGSKSIYADQGQIEQILMNLCVNARDAMGDGGTVTIATDQRSFDQEFVLHNPWARPGRFAMLSVADTGAGVPPEIRERVFEPFFTTKEVGQGTGLGLATVYAITKRHDGLIVLDSEEERGSTFRVFLPFFDGDTEPRAVAATQAWPSGGKETILLAEDDEMVRSWVVRVLGSAGYEVLAAEDGAEAIEVFQQNQERIDLALLDVIMPRRSGREVYQAIRARNPDLPVLFSSGYSHDVLDVGQLPRPDLQLLLKPYDAREVLQKIRTVLDEQP